MIPGMMGIDPNLPTTKELWKDEKSKYRHWVIILAIGLLVITVLTLTSFILNLIDRDLVVENLKDNYKERYKGATEEHSTSWANGYFVRYMIVYASLIIIALFAGIIWYFVSLIEVYKQKNFAKLSQWPTLIVGVGAMISFIQLASILFSSEEQSSILISDASILMFSSRIIYILIYFAASAPISRVRRIFMLSDRVEKMKNDPQFQAMQRQMQNAYQSGQMPYGPFGPVGQNQEAQAKTQAQPQSQQELDKKSQNPPPEEIKKEDPELERLKRLSLEKLKQVASRLSISGYKSMKKDELIEAIMRVTK